VRETDGAIREAVTQREVENAIWDEIHGKRFYLTEQAPICKGKLRGDFGYMANTKAAKEVLAGTYVCPEGTDSGTIDLFEEIACLRSIIPDNSVSTIMWKNGWRDQWRGKKEETSSSESALHFGHYKAAGPSQILSQHTTLLRLQSVTSGVFCLIGGVEACLVCWRKCRGAAWWIS
jgi:hypothetical protein